MCSVKCRHPRYLGARVKAKSGDDMFIRKKTIPMKFMLATEAATTGVSCFLPVQNFPHDILALVEVCAL